MKTYNYLLNASPASLLIFALLCSQLRASNDIAEDSKIERNYSKKSHVEIEMKSLSPNSKVISFINEGQYIEALDYVKAQNGSRYEIIRIISDPVLESNNPDFKGQMKTITTNKEEIKFKWQFESMLEQIKTIPATVFGKASESYSKLKGYATTKYAPAKEEQEEQRVITIQLQEPSCGKKFCDGLTWFFCCQWLR